MKFADERDERGRRLVAGNQTAVSRIWRAFGLKPHLVQTWKLSGDPQFVDKVRDVVGALPGPAGEDDGAGELRWLQAVEKLLPKMNEVFTGSPTDLTPSTLKSLANEARGCSRELARIGFPGTRLQPSYALVKQARQEYDKGAKCLADARSHRYSLKLSCDAEA